MINADFTTIAGIKQATDQLNEYAKRLGLEAHIDVDFYWGDCDLRIYKNDGQYRQQYKKSSNLLPDNILPIFEETWKWLAEYEEQSRERLVKEVASLTEALEKAQKELASIEE